MKLLPEKTAILKRDKIPRRRAVNHDGAGIGDRTHATAVDCVVFSNGSHPRARDRTQGKYARFVQSKETSCYLYTMTQTDDWLPSALLSFVIWRQFFARLFLRSRLALKERGKAVQYPRMTTNSSKNLCAVYGAIQRQSASIIKARRSANDFWSFSRNGQELALKRSKNRYRFIFSEQKAGPVYITNFKLQKWTITIWAAIFFTQNTPGKNPAPKGDFHFTDVIRSGNPRQQSVCQRQRYEYGLCS